MFKLKKKVISSMLVTFLLTTSVFGNDVTAQALTKKAESSTAVTVESEQVAANNYGLVSVTEGNILHAWDWKFTDVTNNIQTIAESGYSIVQVSPCQVCEDTTTNNDWWKLYQPYDYAFGNSLGTEAEFKTMCATAETYGISIVVDVVANHMAGTGEGACETRKPEVVSWWTDEKFHHTGVKFTGDYDNNREMMVTSNIGMPDVDTSRSDVQERMIAYLEKLLDMGADGFRYDAAKHIGTTSDTGNSKDTFWKNISQAVSAKRPDALVYGEILNSMPVSDKYYVADGIKVTESQKGWDMKDAVQKGLSNAVNGDKPTAKDVAFTYVRESSADKLITWVENHDTYLNYWGSTGLVGNANYMSDEQIILAWSTVGARADAQALFFARPDGCSLPKDPSNPDASNTIDGVLGISTKNTIWKDTRVAVVNQFKNAMVGTSETLSAQGDVAIIVRGNKGVVATNFSNSNASFSASGLTGLADGTYTDASGQNGSFTVSGGQVSGTIKGNSFVVLYDKDDVIVTEPPVSDTPVTAPPVSDTPSTDTKITFSKDSSSFEQAFDVTINVENAEYAYYSYDGAAWEKINNGTATVKIGADAANNGDAYGLFVHAKGLDGQLYDVSKTYTYTKESAVTSSFKIRVSKTEFASAPYIYVYSAAGVAYSEKWPGDKMVEEGNYYVYTNDSITSAVIILSLDGWRSTPDQAPGLTAQGTMEYNKSAGTLTAYVDTTGEPSGTAKPVKTPTALEPPFDSTDVPDTQKPPYTTESPVIKTSLADGSSFYDETAEVELSFENTVQASYTVDDGPVQTIAINESANTAKVTIGLGKIADTDVTLKVTAANANGQQVEETYTYHKIFVKKVSVVNALSTFATSISEKITEEVGTVNAGLSGAPGASYYATNPNGNVGAEKTITSASDFTEDMIIAQGAANDDPRIFRGSHEGPVYDLYAMYGAWDDENVFIGIQYTNVTDVVDPAQGYPISDNGKPSNGDIPQMIVFDRGTGDYTDGTANDVKQKTAWDIDVKYAGGAYVDAVFTYSSKPEVKNMAFFPVVNGIVDYNSATTTAAGTVPVTYRYEDGFFGSHLYGINGNGYAGYVPDDLNSDSSNWVDFLTTGHDEKQDTFMTMTIPYSLLGISKSDIEAKGLGIMAISTFGASGTGSLPMDMTMVDNATEPYSFDESSSMEKEDSDVVTVPLARLGNGSVSPSTPKPPTPTSVPPTPTADVPTTPPTSVPPTPTADVPTTSPDDAAYCVNFGADRSAPQYDTTELTLSAVVYNGTAPYTYAFSVDGTEVQNSAEASYKWKGVAGDHIIKVVVTDAEGKTTSSEKQYIITDSGIVIPATEVPVPIITETPITEPTGVVPTAVVPTEVVPTEVVPIETAPATEVPPVAETEVPTTEAPPALETPIPIPTVTPGDGTTTGTKKEGLSIQTFSTDPLSTQELGSSVTLKAEASGGTGTVKYSYIIVNQADPDDVITIEPDEAATTTEAIWTPVSAGTYVLYATVFDENDDSDFAALNYTITEPAASDNAVKSIKIKLNKTTPQYRGRDIKITASVTGGSNLQYKFTLINTKTKAVKVLQKYSTSKSVVWTPGKNDIGTYKFRVLVKSNGVKAGNATSAKFKIKNKKLSIDSTSVTAASKYYAVAANTAGGYGTIKYKYVIKNAKGKVVFKRAYKTTRIAKWKPTKGTYKIYTYVKDSKTTKTSVKKKKITKKL